jgi:hypothetical protein
MCRPINADGERQVSTEQVDMVSKWWMSSKQSAEAKSIENLRRIERDDFFANSRRFNFNANTCDLSTTVGDQSSGSKAAEQVRRPE